ncbi:hypothetical protein [Granulicella sp. L60]|uniref:hypothetical protein n=1 Tax=Granulicella sp. L60 TaxID=1641866 RepID=UPI00131CF3F2|nr:hypothetical protein [Granulicella sp. L60]
MRIDRLCGVRVLFSIAALAILASAVSVARGETPSLASSSYGADAAAPDDQSIATAFKPHASPNDSGTFTISATPPTPFIRGAGATSYQVTLTSVGSFADQINLACFGLPADATCTFTDNPTLTAGATITTTMTVTTTVADAALRRPAIPGLHPTDLAPVAISAVFPLELTWFGVLLFGRRKTSSTQKARLGTVLLLSLGILGLAGCGGPPTVFHSYTINITGSSVNLMAPTQSTSVLLSVGNQ